METTVLVALITGACSVAAVIITNMTSNRQIEQKLDIQQAVLEERIANLSDRVDKHNNLISRTYALEKEVDVLKERISNR